MSAPIIRSNPLGCFSRIWLISWESPHSSFLADRSVKKRQKMLLKGFSTLPVEYEQRLKTWWYDHVILDTMQSHQLSLYRPRMMFDGVYFSQGSEMKNHLKIFNPHRIILDTHQYITLLMWPCLEDFLVVIGQQYFTAKTTTKQSSYTCKDIIPKVSR